MYAYKQKPEQVSTHTLNDVGGTENKQTTKRATQDSTKQQTQLIGGDATDMGIKASTSPSDKGRQTRVEHSFSQCKNATRIFKIEYKM